MLVSVRSPGAGEPRLLEVSTEGLWQPAGTTRTADLGAGLWALPGLADSHAHLGANNRELEGGDPREIARRAFACVESGVFLIVDKGWSDDSVVIALSDAPPGRVPDWEAAGRMIAVPEGYFPGFAIETDAAGLETVVADAVAGGNGWAKLVGDWPRKGRGAVANFDEAELATAVEVAHRGGARVAIHTMAPEVPSMAVRAGVDSIEHGLFLTRDDLALLGSRGGAWVPTVVRMEETAAMLGHGSSGGRLIMEGLDNVAALLPDAPEDVAVLAGSDIAVAPWVIGAEVTRLSELGLAVDRAVAATSTTARRYLGRPSGFAVGEPADAVFFARDPLEDPRVLTEPDTVMRAGRIL